MNTSVIKDYTGKFRACQRGLVTVELAIILPLIILIMLATAEFGRAFYQYTTLSKAVEAGARYYASVALDPSVTDTVALPTTENLIVFASPDGSGSAILPSFTVSDVTEISLNAVPDHVRVSAEYDFVPLIGGIPIFGSAASFTMTATHTMRAL
jgi:Flp pilus assembly protein TadG